ncbi:MAG: J domain-containing protein, partial [Massilia sp.]
MNVWDVLGIAPTGDEREIKRAYARRLKCTRPEDDPLAFQELHDAYEFALRVARHGYIEVDEEFEDEGEGEVQVQLQFERAGETAPSDAAPEPVREQTESFLAAWEPPARATGGGADQRTDSEGADTDTIDEQATTGAGADHVFT